uniref:THO complex subunit 6 n=1 Tax=Timema genevievae TaxID=629358 RepID=A0A7R9PJQ0_TIMGE|nr:unnamed protein product [Timema genevievae]
MLFCRLQKTLSPGDNLSSSSKQVEYHFTAKQDVQVCSMVTTEKFLITGMVGEIVGWNWKSIKSSTNPRLDWEIQIPTPKDALEKPDVNSLIFDKTKGLLYAGCGDDKIYVFNLESRQLLRTMEGHEDFVHCLHNLGNILASASEDGLVKLWDLRQKEPTKSLQPHLKQEVARPALGKWVGTVALSEDWLLCGGGPRLSLWHLRTLDVTTSFNLDDNGIHVAMFYDDRVMAGGASPHFYHLNYSGDVYAQVPSSSTTIYSAVYQELPHKVMCLAGSSNKIDLCTNFSYRDQVLSFSPYIKPSTRVDYPRLSY